MGRDFGEEGRQPQCKDSVAQIHVDEDSELREPNIFFQQGAAATQGTLSEVSSIYSSTEQMLLHPNHGRGDI